jgi:hypothetical protein
VIVTVVESGDLSWAPPVGLPKLTIRVSSLSTSLSLLMSIVKVLSSSSPSFQFKVPEVVWGSG